MSRLGSVVGGVVLSILAFAPRAEAQEAQTDYCRRVTAQAQGDAALLFAPTVTAQVVKYPATGVADATGIQVGKEVQPRLGMSLGLVDIYKGVGVLDVAHADCKREQATVRLRELLEMKADIGRLPALQRELDFLRAGRTEVAAMVTKSEERLAAKLATLLEVAEARRKALDLDRKIAQVEGEIAVVSQRRPPVMDQSVRALLEQHDQRAMEYENSVAHVRNLQPWQLNVSGGAVARPVVDYFGMVELSYNFGGIVRNGAESRSLEAREREIKTARYELHDQVVRLMDELRASVAQMTKEIAAIDAHLARLEAEQKSLAGADAPNRDQIVASLRFEAIALQADRTYLAALVEQRNALAPPSAGPMNGR